jgi:tagatose 6-phosphate kinase
VILSAGLTPAWQQILVFDAFRYGEVNRARQVAWCSSGKVFNAGIAAHHLGGPSVTLAPVGGPPLEQIEREFEEMELPCHFVATRAATRVCTTILDRATGTMTELVEDGRPLSRAELDMFCRAYAEESAKADVAVIIGSLPLRTPVSLYRHLLEKTPCPAVLDFRGEGLLSALDLKPLVAKPNRQELAATIGRGLDSDAALLEAMRSLNHRGAQWVVVTQGGGPVWLSSASQTYRLYPPPVEKQEIVNPIGCGDAMAAAIAWAVRDGRPMVEAVRFGIAAAGENLRGLLPCRLDPAKVEQGTKQVRVEKL